MEKKLVCSHPEDCCRELSRVWETLGPDFVYDGRSCHEHVADLRTQLRKAEERIKHLHGVIATSCL